MVGTYYPDPPNIALFIEHRTITNHDMDLLPGPKPPVKEELDVKVGPLNINMVLSKMTSLLGGGENPLVPFLDDRYQVASEDYAQKMRRYQVYLREMHQRYSKVQAVLPSCKKMFPGSQHSVYQPAAKYQGRAFYCPGNKTFYFYVKELTDILKKDKDGNDYVEVTYMAKPKESYVLLPDLIPDDE